MRPVSMALVLAVLVPAPGMAQFSSDFPGVPRAGIAQHGPSQGRFEMDFTGMRIAGEGATPWSADSSSVSLRMGFGRSWRVASQLEVGYDVSLADGRLMYIASPSDSAADGAELDMAAMVAYGLRVGVKYRPLAYLDPQGYGWSSAVGVALQPSLRPGVVYTQQGDSTTVQTIFGGGEEDGDGGMAIHASTLLYAGLSYRTPRIEMDVAFLTESADLTSAATSPISIYEGTSLRAAGRYRVTPSLAVGAAYWGSGAPPWRDQIAFGVREREPQSFGLLLTFGPHLEKGTDLMISSPTGDFTESISLHLRIR
jgi:hypothetical protein